MSTEGTPPKGRPAPPVTNTPASENPPPSEPPAGTPRMTGLQPNQARKRPLTNRVTTSATSGQTEGMKKNTPDQLLQKRNEVLRAINDLAVKSGNLRILSEAMQAIQDPAKAPKGIVIKVMVDNKWVSFIPPDKEGLEGQDMDKLRAEVQAAVAEAHAGCAKVGSQEQVNAQLSALHQQFIGICTKLGKEAAKEENMQMLLQRAISYTPKQVKVDYDQGAVLIERIEEAPRPKTKEKPGSNNKPQPQENPAEETPPDES